MTKSERIEYLIDQAKREGEGMSKNDRISLLEQRVAELIGEVEKLKQAELARQGWWSYPKPQEHVDYGVSVKLDVGDGPGQISRGEIHEMGRTWGMKELNGRD